MRRLSLRRVVGGAVVLGLLAWFVAAFLGGPFGTPACAAAGVRVDLRVLVVTATGNDAIADAWEAELAGEGVPYDRTSGQVDEGVLVADDGHGRYQGVVVTDSHVLDPAETAVVDAYQRTYGVRRVDAWVSPGGDAGIALPNLIARFSDTSGQLTDAGRAVFPYLRGEVPFEFSFGFLPGPDPAITPLVTNEGGQPLLGTRTTPDGREVLFVVPQVAPGLLQWRLLAHGLIGWVTDGAHLGLRRAWFAVHVDDLFLPNFVWNEELDATDRTRQVRTTPDDIRFAASWSRSRDFRLDIGFNALGRDPGLCQAVLAEKDAFGWFNHTYSHLDMDRLDAETMTREIEDNVRWAEQQGIPLDPSELVTGAHTGLENPALPDALSAAGVTHVGADVTEDPVPRDIGPARTVPRYPTNIYYDAGTIEQDLAEYNHRYFEDCTPAPTTSCLDRPATWEELLATDSRIMLGHVLGNDPRTHYVHQSNLAADRILFPGLDLVLERYRSLVSTPLLQPTLTASSRALERQLAWAEALADGAVEAWRVGDELHVRTTRSVEVPITGMAEGGERYGEERSGWVRVRPGRPLTLRTRR